MFIVSSSPSIISSCVDFSLGSPLNHLTVAEIVARAQEEASIYVSANVVRGTVA